MGNKGSSENTNPDPPQSVPINQPKPPCKPKVIKYSTKPELIGKPCETHQGTQWCWPRYQVCDMQKITGCDKEERIEKLRCSNSAFRNNIIGIGTNVHSDLEGSALSLKEGFKEGAGMIDSAGVESVAAQARSAGARARTKIDNIGNDVVNYGNKHHKLKTFQFINNKMQKII